MQNLAMQTDVSTLLQDGIFMSLYHLSTSRFSLV